jgi:ribosome-associated translation inhibitor RaiA
MMLSLDEETFQAIQSLGWASGKPGATVVREVLSAAKPQLVAMAEMLTSAKNGLLTEVVAQMKQTHSDMYLAVLEAGGDLAEIVRKAQEKSDSEGKPS